MNDLRLGSAGRAGLVAGASPYTVHVVTRPPADHADQPVAADEPFELCARLGRRIRVYWSRDDRREHAVEVEEDAGFGGRGRKALEQRVGGRGHALSIGGCG